MKVLDSLHYRLPETEGSVCMSKMDKRKLDDGVFWCYCQTMIVCLQLYICPADCDRYLFCNHYVKGQQETV